MIHFICISYIKLAILLTCWECPSFGVPLIIEKIKPDTVNLSECFSQTRDFFFSESVNGGYS